MALCIVANVGVAFSTHPVMFIVCRIVLGAFGVATQACGAIIAVELVPNKFRAIAMMVFQLAFPFGVMLSSGLAYFIREWRMLQLCVVFVTVPILILFIILVPESPRWLCWKGRGQESSQILSMLARRNGKEIPDMVIKSFGNLHLKTAKGEAVPPGRYKELFTKPIIRRCVLSIAFIWSSCNFMYFAVSYNLDNMFGDMYINQIIFGVIEVFVMLTVTYAVKRVGRIRSTAVFLVIALLGGVVGIIALIIGDLDLLVTVSAMICRACGTGGNVIIYLYLLELFPTPLVNHASAVSNLSRFSVGLLSPYAAGSLTDIWSASPYVIYTAMAGISLILVLWLPETKGRNQPETVQELELLKSATDEATDELTDESKDNMIL